MGSVDNKHGKVNELSPNEIKYICHKIKLETFKTIFKQYSQNKSVSDLYRGYRVDKLTNAQLFSIILENKNNNFVNNILEGCINDWLKEINENISNLQKDGFSSEEAIFKAVNESVFHDNCELYFKLSESLKDDEYLNLFKSAISYIDKCKITDNSTNSKYDSLNHFHNKHTKLDLKDQYDENKNQNSEDFKRLKKVESEQIEEIKSLKKELAECRSQLEKFDCRHREVNANELQSLHTSICKIERNNRDVKIKRLADVEDNEIKIFSYDPQKPPYYDNRNRIFIDGKIKNNCDIDVWNWYSIPNEKDPSKDIVRGEYNNNIIITEIVELHDCKTIDELATLLMNGLKLKLISKKVLFVFMNEEGKKKGLLCSPGTLEYSGLVIKISKSVVMLPQFELKNSDIVNIEGIKVYRKIHFENSKNNYQVIKPYDLIKEKVLARTLYLKEGKVSKTEIQKYKHFLKLLPTKTIVEEISKIYEFSEEQANHYVAGFIESIEKYFNCSDLDTKIISAALERNETLLELCKKLIFDELKSKNDKNITELNNCLKVIEQNKIQAENELNKLNEEKNNLASEVERIRKSLNDVKRLAPDVDIEVSKYIDGNNKNLAGIDTQISYNDCTKNAASDQCEKSVYVFDCKIKSEFEETTIEDLEDFEDKLNNNFKIIGYEENIAYNMAFAVSFCICNNIPIVLRENSMEISRCVAALINSGHLYEIFVPIDGVSMKQFITGVKNIAQSEQFNVFLVHGVFDGCNLNFFNALVNILKNFDYNILIFISIEGLSLKMIPSNVWNKAFYVDGDAGLINITTEKIYSYNFSLASILNEINEMAIDSKEFKRRRDSLEPFSSIIGCLHMNLYAKYLVMFNRELNRSDVILNQLIANACSSDNEEILESLFIKNSLTRGNYLLSRMPKEF
ncbi:hypothetical protein [Succinimonas sp.]|uniref:hypothetical protein n=1 Tax=Succinimonas sp. TaxID=1936151 RepID=UPI00386C27E7